MTAATTGSALPALHHPISKATSVSMASFSMLATMLQLKIAYSVHRDLNVKANNDKSWDYGGGTPGAAAGPGPPTNGYNPSAGGSLAADDPPTGSLIPQDSAGRGCLCSTMCYSRRHVAVRYTGSMIALGIAPFDPVTM